MVHEVSVEVGGRPMVFKTGQLAKQANGSILGTYGESSVLATACCSSSINENLDFIPLQVEYNERYYAAGKIPGGFIKRETRPKDKEILVSRLIDRPMRPLFHKNFMREIQLIPTVMSTDQINPPDILAMCSASAAVLISDIPFDGPVGAVRVARVDGQLLINPTFEQIEKAELEIIIAGTLDGITMVEGGSKEVSEEDLLDAIEFSRESITNICNAQIELAEKCGKEKLALVEVPEFELTQEVQDYARADMEVACYVKGKFERHAAVNDVIEKAVAHFSERVEEADQKKLYKALNNLEQEIVRNNILSKQERTDGRSPTQIRPIECASKVLPRTHGTGLFTRGETQALAIVTLGSASDEQIFDDIDGDRRERFLLHYNFPPYSVGETGRLMTGRREIGHGHLAFRAIEPILPESDKFPYTLRVVSEVLESNGSSSMATVCSGSLALMDAGVPVKDAVAGIAMGLISDGEKHVVLSDILGEEDHLGDMDFKVAGTKKGITAFQMDIKIKNIDFETMKTALAQAKDGRMHILDIMNKTIDKSNDDLSEYAPRVIVFNVNPDEIGLLIGAGGKTIRAITEKYNVQVNIEDTGQVTVYSKDLKVGNEAKDELLRLLEEPEVGSVYTGVVKRITDFGAFVEILPGKEGLCHISRISADRVDSVHDVLKLNDEVEVKIIELDRMGRINLAINDENILKASAERDSQRNSGSGDRDRGGRNHHGRDRDRKGGHGRGERHSDRDRGHRRR